MTQNTISEGTKITYDDRHKILHQKKTKVFEHIKDEVTEDGKVTEKAQLISTVSQDMNVDYTEAGIRLAHKNLAVSKKASEKLVEDLEEQFIEKKKFMEENPIKEMPKDLKELQEKILEISKYAGAEKKKAEFDAFEENFKAAKKELADISKEFKGLIDEIGTRLKF